MKTNKSFAKRLKLTKRGKLLSRATGQNHFNSRESGRSKLAKRNARVPFRMSMKEKSRFLIGL